MSNFLNNIDKANCASTDPELFFPELEDYRAGAVAMPVCAMCEIATECLSYAIENEKYGIWGGATSVERQRMKRYPKNRIVHLARLSDLAKSIREREENNG